MRRREFITCAGAAAFITQARGAAPLMSTLGIDAAQFGLHPGSPDDQTAILQRAIDAAARGRQPLAIPPGVYRAGALKLPAGAQLAGVRGQTRLVSAAGSSLLEAENADGITLSGLIIDGGAHKLPPQRGLLHIAHARGLKIADCDITNAGGDAIRLFAADGQIVDNRLTACADAAIHSDDAAGLIIARNTIRDAGDNGIQVWRMQSGDDGTIITDNRIEAVANRSGGSGQYGNAINIFRAANVIVRGNRIVNCAFSAVRGNAASNLIIEGNAVTNAREVALYAEFGFEGALIANNIVDSAAIGVSVTNFNEGGRLAVVQGNLIRNLGGARPAGTDPNDGSGIGIAVEADSAVTGNTIENAPFAGIVLGYGRFLRDVAATGNVVRGSAIGIGVSVAAGAGTALIANNAISGATRGAIVGMDRKSIVTGDLMKDGAAKYAGLTLSGNRAS